MIRSTIRSTSLATLLVLALAAAAPGAALAGQNPPAPPPPVVEDDPDRDPNPSQPDFTIVNLPTTLRVPRFKSAFRVTHRFGRPLGEGTFGDAAENQFGLDAGAIVGLEYRFGLMRGLQVGILRTSNRTIDFTASEEGRFPILCSEYCGDDHDDMTGMLVVRGIERAPEPEATTR